MAELKMAKCQVCNSKLELNEKESDDKELHFDCECGSWKYDKTDKRLRRA